MWTQLKPLKWWRWSLTIKQNLKLTFPSNLVNWQRIYSVWSNILPWTNHVSGHLITFKTANHRIYGWVSTAFLWCQHIFLPVATDPISSHKSSFTLNRVVLPHLIKLASPHPIWYHHSLPSSPLIPGNWRESKMKYRCACFKGVTENTLSPLHVTCFIFGAFEQT